MISTQVPVPLNIRFIAVLSSYHYIKLNHIRFSLFKSHNAHIRRYKNLSWRFPLLTSGLYDPAIVISPNVFFTLVMTVPA